MPTALEAGRYISKGCDVHDQRQYVRTTGFPEPSTCAIAARRSGVITFVAYVLKMGAYCRHVSDRCLVECSANGKEQLRWLADDLINPVDGERQRQDDRHTNDDLLDRRCAPESAPPTSSQASVWPKT